MKIGCKVTQIISLTQVFLQKTERRVHTQTRLCKFLICISPCFYTFLQNEVKRVGKYRLIFLHKRKIWCNFATA